VYRSTWPEDASYGSVNVTETVKRPETLRKSGLLFDVIDLFIDIRPHCCPNVYW